MREAFRRHRSFAAASATGVAVAGALWPVRPDWAIIAGWDAFFTAFLTLGLIVTVRRDNAGLRVWAGEDEPPAILFLTTAGAAAVAMFYLFREVNRSTHDPVVLWLVLVSVPLGWATLHLMAAFHYARMHFAVRRSRADPDRDCGLVFAGGEAPDGWDFVYFSFVVGMTAQTSDVEVASAQIRRFTLLHSVLSFFFNTVLVAAAVNIAVSLP